MLREISKQETQEAILDAAERLLNRYGYAKMTMTDLAEEAGIGVGTTYLYFPGKLEVALAVLERLLTRINSRLQEIAMSTVPPEQKIREMLIARLQLRYESARNRHHKIDEFKQAVQYTVDQRRAGWLEAEARLFVPPLEEGLNANAFEFEDADEMAETLMRATSCLTPNSLSRSDFKDPALFNKKIEQITTLLVRGLRPQKQV